MILFLLCLLFGVATTMYLQPQINIDIHTDNTTQVEEKRRDNVWVDDTAYVYLGLSEVASADFYTRFFDNLEAYYGEGGYIFNSSITYASFLADEHSHIEIPCVIPTREMWFGYVNANAGNTYFTYATINAVYVDYYKNYNHLGYNKLTFTFMIEPSVNSFLYAEIFYRQVSGLGTQPMYSTYITYNNYSVSGFDLYNILIKYNKYNFQGILPSFATGSTENERLAYDKGYNDAMEYAMSDNGLFEEEYEHGYFDGRVQGDSEGYTRGYNEAKAVYEDVDATANSIFGGIFSIGLLPVNVFLKIFDWNVFGINIAGFVSGILSIAVIVIILRFILGRKE